VPFSPAGAALIRPAYWAKPCPLVFLSIPLASLSAAPEWYPSALVAVSVNSLLALLVLWALLAGSLSPLCRTLRESPFQPLAVAVAAHWLIYFGPMNFGAILLQSQVQSAYAWIVRKPLMAEAALFALVAYPLLLAVLAVLAWMVRNTPLALRWKGLPRAPYSQLLALSILMALLAAWIAPFIATRVADRGAFYGRVPLPLVPFLKGLFPLEAVPLLAAILRSFSLPHPAPPRELPRFLAVAGLQLVTFILLRQRFLTLVAVVLVGFALSRWWKRRWLLGGVPLGLLVAYAIPTALRYGRFPPRPGQPFSDYLAQSTRNFIGGLLPGQMIASVVNDFSYNKAGMASLSVLLDLRRSQLLSSHDPFGWLPAELFRVLPGAIKQRMPEWGGHGAEALVSRALGVGGPGWTNWGLPKVIPRDFVIDMMETPLLNPVANGGMAGVVLMALITGLSVGLIWWLVCRLSLRWSWCWLLPFGLLFAVGQGPSWLGDVLVTLKISPPWLALAALVAAYARWSHSASTTQRQ